VPDYSLHFPALEEYIERGSCGQKGCSPQLVIGGIRVPVHLKLAGSGKPDADSLQSIGEGTLVPWKYNNMMTHTRGLGWIVARLDSQRTSVAELGRRRINDNEVPTVVRAELFFRFHFPRFRARIRADDPVHLVLTDISAPTLFFFGQQGATRIAGPRTTVLEDTMEAPTPLTSSDESKDDEPEDQQGGSSADQAKEREREMEESGEENPE
jgi:hypothetical protein